jgi:hypothetical protein
MGWMKAIALDIDELVETVEENAGKDPAMGELQEAIDAKGWISPTVAGLCRTLIAEVTPLGSEDAEKMQRITRLLGAGDVVTVVQPAGDITVERLAEVEEESNG